MFPSLNSIYVPKCYRALMTDNQSEIIDFYPQDFFVDLKDKKYEWLAEVILPFIEADRLV